MDKNSQSEINLSLIKLIFDYMRAQHPLAASIPREAAPGLSQDFALRIGAGEGILDFSPNSLKLVEKLLVNYHANNPNGISDDETMKLIRELAAYIGEVLARHTDGMWVVSDDEIWNTELLYEGNWILMKEGIRRPVSTVVYILADEAAGSWQNVLDGKSPHLFKLFKEIQKRELREELTYKK